IIVFDAFRPSETQDFGEEFYGAWKVDPVNLPMIHSRRLHSMKSIRPRSRVHISKAVAHLFLFGVKLDVMTGRNLEAHTLTPFPQFGRGKIVDLAAKLLDIPREALECCFAVDLECDEITSRDVGLTQNDAVMIKLIPGLQIHAALVITACDIQANHFS